jgi:general secretion pathway protein J
VRPREVRASGFTLIELIVAIFITAIMCAIGYGALNQALQQHDGLQARQDRLSAVETTMRIMVQDFSELTPRPVRDVLGTSSLPCVLAMPAGQSFGLGGTGAGGLGSSFGSSTADSSSSAASPATPAPNTSFGSPGDSTAGQDLVTFTRIGWANPAGIQRPALERVSYRLENGVLRRLHLPVLDATEATAPLKRDLIDHVKSVTFRFMTDARAWSDQWPPSGMGGPPALRMRPLAVQITLELEDWGQIVRVIEVPT